MKLTIEMPNRNRAWYLDRSIPLLAKQTLNQDDWELIIVDDGSTDESEQIIQKYKKMNIIKNFHFVKNTKKRTDKQGSPTLTCNIAIKESLGDYILHTDPEIMTLPNWAELHYLSHENEKNRIIWGNCLHPREYHIITDESKIQYKGAFLGNIYTGYNWSNIEETWKNMNDKISKVQSDFNLKKELIHDEFFNDYQAGFSMPRKLLFDIRGHEENFCNKNLGLDKYGGDDFVFYHHIANSGRDNGGIKKIVNNNIRAIHVCHPKFSEDNVASDYAWKYIQEHPYESKANLGREWGLIKENGFVKVF